MRKQA